MRKYLVALSVGVVCIFGCGGTQSTLLQAVGIAQPDHARVGALLATSPTHYEVLHRFRDGGFLLGTLVLDAAGNLYGTAQDGGGFGFGLVFKMDPSGNETVLHSFNHTDGQAPEAGVILDAAGNMYGTTCCGGAFNQGVVFELDPTGNETVLHSFNGTDGALVNGGVIRDAAGNLFGTTIQGGSNGLGVVFKLDSSGNETVLHSFSDADGSAPYAGLVGDDEGRLYGTTNDGGSSGEGVIFKIDSTGSNFIVLHNFTGADGGRPWADLIPTPAGNFVGAASVGGSSDDGVVYKINPNGDFTVLHNFGGADGVNPYGRLARDSAGNLYGTTAFGGASKSGVIFELDPSGHVTVLHNFCQECLTGDGFFPFAGLVRNSAGDLYGDTEQGGGLNGVVFKLTH
jgi:uncharacterized repeat protein (TIGR03803 family)